MSPKTKSVLAKLILGLFVLAILMIAFYSLYHYYQRPWMLSVAITLFTIFYHFAMRLIVGEAVTVAFRGKEFPQDRLGFRLYDFEKDLYRKLNVKQWKLNVITAKPEQFDLKQVSPQELLHNVMQAEFVHRLIMIFSFVPIFFIIPFGAPLAFILTSVFASLFDCVFVIIQRYNRPRVIKYMTIMERR